MRLDLDGVWIITAEQLSILEAAERLATSNDFISPTLLRTHSRARRAFTELALDLVDRKFLSSRDGHFRLTISGHDCLAVNALKSRGLTAMGSPIGIGKESDIYYAEHRGRPVALKIHRLGRTSFQKVAERRLRGDTNWFEKNRENCRREAAWLRTLAPLAVPHLIDCNRHVLVLELLDKDPLYRLRVSAPHAVAAAMFRFIADMWALGFVHGDFNEFNVLVEDPESEKLVSENSNEEIAECENEPNGFAAASTERKHEERKTAGRDKEIEGTGKAMEAQDETSTPAESIKITVVDFPQCVAITDSRAPAFLKRDIECVHRFFWRRHRILCDDSLLADVIAAAGIEIERPSPAGRAHYADRQIN